MNIAIVGYGKMGHEIENAAKGRGHSFVTIDPNDKSAQYREINKESLNGVDVCVDFTHPSSVLENIRKISSFKKNIVVGTTGWYDKLDEARKIAEHADIGLIWSGNFSIGVNIYFKMIENAARIMNKFSDYDVFVHEFHHNQKADSPSGTAIMAAKIILSNLGRKKKIVTEELKRKINPDELHVSSTRAGTITGTHIVGFDSAADYIEIKHFAKSRQGFALGAIMAAEWI
ncbi:MAG: 4-hydroxy-tetrahydrodipicolinate reductase, partial [Nanoarchaeota archaeon]